MPARADTSGRKKAVHKPFAADGGPLFRPCPPIWSETPENCLQNRRPSAIIVYILSRDVSILAEKISKSVLKRLPVYLAYLKSLGEDAPEHISATALANALTMGEVQVRKDLALVSDGGRPKVGYLRLALIDDLEQFLGYDNTNDAVLIGAGKLGRALLDYKGFSEYGLNIVAAFDSDEKLFGKREGGKPILPLERLEQVCTDRKILIGIITVPAPYAQGVCDLLIANGIQAVWNFAPTHLDVPEGILVQNENMAASLAVLSKHLSAQIKGF